VENIDSKILELLRISPQRSLSRRDLAARLGLKGQQRKQLTAVLKRMVRRRQLILLRGDRYRVKESYVRVEGTLSMHPRGFAFVCTDETRSADWYVAPQHIGGAMDGDLVRARLLPRRSDRKGAARVEQVLHRAHTTLAGRYLLRADGARVEPLNPALGEAILVSALKEGPVGESPIVEVRITDYATANRPARGRVVQVLGPQDDPLVDIRAIITDRHLPADFSANVLAEARRIAAQPFAEDISERVDLQAIPVMTIDGETAQDFDDAVAVRQEADGQIRLWVCIADVDSYVRQGSLLDTVAKERGTSVYFPGFCLPMLPEELSHGVCSLMPDQLRPVMVAELLFDQSGAQLDGRFYPASIRSRARLTYTQVARVAQQADDSPAGMPDEVMSQLPILLALSNLLKKKRFERGGLDLEIPEAEVMVDDRGAARQIRQAERNEAHQLIESLMLAANEAVARFLTDRGVPMIYRIHERPKPDKIVDLQKLAKECGYSFSAGRQLATELQQMLSAVDGHAESRLLNQQLLRSLPQAVYSAENLGHFGLGANCYCHFTSPIRRYPDLLVHRVLKAILAQRCPSYDSEAFKSLAEQASRQERRAVEAEREVVDLRRCQLMEQRIGEEFVGLIASVAEFGFFVELHQPFLQGLVHISRLPGGDYRFDPGKFCLVDHHRRSFFRVGDRVRVRVVKVDIGKRTIDFALVDHEAKPIV